MRRTNMETERQIQCLEWRLKNSGSWADNDRKGGTEEETGLRVRDYCKNTRRTDVCCLFVCLMVT